MCYMKKLSLLFLIGITSSLLIGCNKPQVSYSEIDEDTFNAYYQEDKVTAAKSGFEGVTKFYFVMNQVTPEMTYNFSRYLDTNYYYQHADGVFSGNKATDDELYIGSSTVSECNLYKVSTSDGKAIKTGEEAHNLYTEMDYNERRTVNRCIEDPMFIMKEYGFNDSTKKYYKGSDGSLKINATANGTDGYQRNGYVIVNSQTLCVSSLKISLKHSTEGNASISHRYYFGVNFAHKTPHDIGYN